MQEILDKLNSLSETQAVIIANQINQAKSLEKIENDLKDQAEVLTRNTVIVDAHHKRSLNLEDRQEKLEDNFGALKIEIEVEKGKRDYKKQFLLSGAYTATILSAIGSLLWGLYTLAKKLGF